MNKNLKKVYYEIQTQNNRQKTQKTIPFVDFNGGYRFKYLYIRYLIDSLLTLKNRFILKLFDKNDVKSGKARTN